LRPLSLVFIAMIVLTVGVYVWKQVKGRHTEVHYDV
jgi:hypothetical protein